MILSKSLIPALDWICNSSMHIGKLFKNVAIISCPTRVLLNVVTYSPKLGFAHTLAAVSKSTDFPTSVPPQKWQKNGSNPHGCKITLAKDAANAIRATPFSALNSRIASTHFSRLPLDFTELKMCLKLFSPSKTNSST